MLIKSSRRDERKGEQIGKLAGEIERGRAKFNEALRKGQHDKAGELDRQVDRGMQELYHRAREAQGLDR